MGKLLRALAVLGGGYVLYRMVNERQRQGGMITVSSPEEAFLRDAAMANLEEVRMGNIAQQRSGDADIRQLGQRLVEDHTQILGRLRDLAVQRQFKLPNVLSDRMRRMEERLYGMSGEAFDQEFVRSMMQDHARDLSKFRAQLMHSQDEHLRRFIEETVPVLEEHHRLVQRIADRLNVEAQAAS